MLTAGAAALIRAGGRARPLALAAIAFAVAGFGVGLDFTIRGGADLGAVYHLVVLPLLLLTPAALLRPARR